MTKNNKNAFFIDKTWNEGQNLGKFKENERRFKPWNEAQHLRKFKEILELRRNH